PAPLVESLLLLDGLPVRLQTGVEIKPPVEVRLDPLRLSLMPGVERRVPLQLRTMADEPVTARLLLAPSPGLRLTLDGQPATREEIQAIELAVPPLSYAGVQLRLYAAEAGAHT